MTKRRSHLIKDVHDKTWEKFVKKAKSKGLKLAFYLEELVK